jgi:hypothetical protein
MYRCLPAEQGCNGAFRADPVTARWVAFAPPVLEAGVRAVFGFPIRSGTVRLGALNLYREQPGPMDSRRAWLTPSTRLKIELEDHGEIGVSGQRPHLIFRPERASPQAFQRLKSGKVAVDPTPNHQF